MSSPSSAARSAPEQKSTATSATEPRPARHTADATALGWRARNCDGFASLEFVLVTIIALVMFVLLANFVVDQYGRGVLRAAVDEGARAGAQEGNTLADCQARAAAVTGDLLRGSLGSTVQIVCGEANGTVTSRATAAFPGWLPGVPTWNVAIEGRSTREQGPS